MNQGRIWCVVHPTVGLPLFLGAVALTSLAVHTAIMTHTTWMGNYWMGSKARVAMETTPGQTATVAKADTAFSITLTPVPASATAPASFVVTVNSANGTATSKPMLAVPTTDGSGAVTLHAANTKSAN
jgi:light-harvesting protein B-800-850 alpha chain